jgi:hypothetical protein
VRARRAVAIAAAAVLTIAAAVTFGTQYRRAGARLHDQRVDLAAARASLAKSTSSADHARDIAGLTEKAIAATRSEIAATTAARTWMDAVTQNTRADIASVQSSLEQANAGRFLLATNATQTNVCLAGISSAVAANRVGDTSAAVAALRFASDSCTRTLAYATGARFPYDFPDPFVLRAGDMYYAYSTNSGAGDIQVISSKDLVTWQLVGNALPALPGWARAGSTWAPSVLARNGSFVLYYTTRNNVTNAQCVTRAVSRSPAGPFVDDSWGPIVCPDGGAIDPSPFVDRDGRPFLLWKAEGSAAALWSQELTADGRGVSGAPHRLLVADRAFERRVVEGPSLVFAEGTYVLLYSAADWQSLSYTTAYATCAGPAGPCTKPAENRVLRSGSKLAGPGGAEVFTDADGALQVAFHAYLQPNVGYPSSRYLHIAPLRVVDGRPVIDAAT